LGVYGVTSYTVARRTQEIGIRIALGASGGSIARMILRQTVRLTAGGAALGLLGSALLARTLVSLLYGVTPLHPWTLSGVCLLLFLAAATAAYLPARRSARIDPAIALRSDQ
jgi:ABC-type antimicrobial peptide transport system permease subunit